MRSRHLISNINSIAAEWAMFPSKQMGDPENLTESAPQVQQIIKLSNQLIASKCQLKQHWLNLKYDIHAPR